MISKQIRSHSVALAMLLSAGMLASACGSEVTPTATVAPASPATVGAIEVPPAASNATPTAAMEATTVMGQTPGMAGGGMTGGTIKIGFAFVTSGDNAVYGISQKAAAEVAIKSINGMSGDGPTVEGVYEDTAGKPDQAISVFQKLINTDNVDIIIGPTLSNEAKSSDPVAQKAGVPVLAVSNTAGGITDIGDYIFRDSLAEFQVIPETVRQATAKYNLKKVDLLYAKDDAFSKSGADVFRTELGKNNVQIVQEQTFSTTDTDYKTQLTAIKADNPDAIVVSALAKPAQTILQQARQDVGIDPKVPIIGGNGFNSPAVLKAAGTSAEGLVVGAAWNLNAADENSKRFISEYKADTGKDPDQFAAQSYAGVHIAWDAARRAKAGSGKTLPEARTAIRDALKDTKDYPTLLGSFSFTDKRDANHPPVVQIVKDGKFDVLK